MMMASQAETDAMRRALALAATPGVPLGPNPRVGSVILDPSGAVIGEGFHRGRGTAHAEVDALRQAGNAAHGATVVVTLEPCNHVGRTGPCAEALVAAGVRRVVFAQPDLSPVARGGAERLAAAGIDVESGLMGAEASALNRAWSFSQRHGRPFITWKFATTLDGRSAAADGTSQWITGEAARADVHARRAECDAIVVGTGTALADNPRLTVRDSVGEPLPADLQPLRVVVGERPLPADAAVFDAAAPTLVLATRDLSRVVAELHDRDRHHVWLEGGPTLAAGFVRAGLVDEVVAYVAPALLGSGRPAVGDLGIKTIADALRLELVDVAQVGGDVRLTMERGT